MSSARQPLSLLLAVLILGLQSLALLVTAVLAVTDMGSGGSGGIPVLLMLLLAAAGVGACAWGLATLHSWSRAPSVLVQLFALGLAWDVRSGDAWLVLMLVIPAVIGLVGVFHPASTKALDAAE